MKSVIRFCASVVVFVFLAYGIMCFVDMDTGRLIDWGIGLGSFLWIAVIVTVPWNAHFKAREVLDEYEISQDKGIFVQEGGFDFAERVAKNSIWVAVGLHLITASALFIIAKLEISPVGYIAAALAAGLTFLRPSIRFYDYLTRRLSSIKKEFRFPREDVQSLLARVQVHDQVLDTDVSAKSWYNKVNQTLDKLNIELQESKAALASYITTNDDKWTSSEASIFREFDVVREEQKDRLAKITEDSQILDSVRHLATFVKDIRS